MLVYNVYKRVSWKDETSMEQISFTDMEHTSNVHAPIVVSHVPTYVVRTPSRRRPKKQQAALTPACPVV